jgi:hypothetical protein
MVAIRIDVRDRPLHECKCNGILAHVQREKNKGVVPWFLPLQLSSRRVGEIRRFCTDSADEDHSAENRRNLARVPGRDGEGESQAYHRATQQAGGTPMAEVFISFIHEEEEVANAVRAYLDEALNELAAEKTAIFMASDQWQIYAGEIWLDRVMQELKNAKLVILMLSTESVRRPWVNFEAGGAWLRDIPLIPVCYGALTKDSLPKPYSSIQALDIPPELYYLATSAAHHLKLAIAPPPKEYKAELGVGYAIAQLNAKYGVS